MSLCGYFVCFYMNHSTFARLEQGRPSAVDGVFLSFSSESNNSSFKLIMMMIIPLLMRLSKNRGFVVCFFYYCLFFRSKIQTLSVSNTT